ncbi:MAG: hypothetical protein DRJ97_02540 [Thermoprotei archaeon]|nr:MAG: hypothetical protein DRJ97_02540 [Thermoprotei archaeon]
MKEEEEVKREVLRNLKAFSKGILSVLIMQLLLEKPRHGYELMQELRRRTLGLWKPSPGSLYPALRRLEDKGYVESSELKHRGRLKHIYSLTNKGRLFINLLMKEIAERVSRSDDLSPMILPCLVRLDLVDLLDPGTLEIVKALLEARIRRLQSIIERLNKLSSEGKVNIS